MSAEPTPVRQTCPRRMGEPGPWERDADLDAWTTGHGLVGQDQVGASCSFCGSLNPDRFMELVREGWVVGPTDKNYKVYLARPYTDDDVARRKAKWVSSDSVAVAIRSLGERERKTPAQIQSDLERHWDEMVAPLTSGSTEAKFYFQHLSDAQRTEFIELHNAGRMKIGYPGHLYVRPYFATAAGSA